MLACLSRCHFSSLSFSKHPGGVLCASGLVPGYLMPESASRSSKASGSCRNHTGHPGLSHQASSTPRRAVTSTYLQLPPPAPGSAKGGTHSPQAGASPDGEMPLSRPREAEGEDDRSGANVHPSGPPREVWSSANVPGAGAKRARKRPAPRPSLPHHVPRPPPDPADATVYLATCLDSVPECER